MATIPVAKLGVKLNIGDPNIVIYEDDVLTGLVYQSGNELKTIDGTVRVIHATTKANNTSPDECPPEPYVHRYITPTAFVIDSSEQYDAELTRINISSIVSIGQVNGVGDFANVDGTTYDSVNSAVENAADGASVKLTQDAVLTTPLAPNGITLDGNGKTLMFNTESGSLASDPALVLVNGKTGMTMKNLGLDTRNCIKHAVQLYLGDGAVIENCDIVGGPYTGILVNGATNVTIKDTKIEVSDDAYACIEYCMGSNVTTVPTMTIDNVVFNNSNGKYAIWADASTFERVRAVLGEGTSDDGVLEYIKSCITNKNATSVKMYVGLPNGGIRTITLPVEK